MKVDWKQLVKTIAPTIGTALGGPMGGMAVKALSDSLLGHSNGSEDEVAQAILNATPDQLLAIKKADQDFELAMEKLGVDVYKIDADDRASARNMAIQTTIWPQVTISVLYNAGYFWLLWYFLSHMKDNTMDEWTKGMIGLLVGILTAMIPQINNFWFGSSHGSKDKTTKLTSLGG